MENQGRSLVVIFGIDWLAPKTAPRLVSSHSADELQESLSKYRDRDRTFLFSGLLSLEEVTISAGIKDPICHVPPKNVHVGLIIHLSRLYVCFSVC